MPIARGRKLDGLTRGVALDDEEKVTVVGAAPGSVEDRSFKARLRLRLLALAGEGIPVSTLGGLTWQYRGVTRSQTDRSK